MLARDVVSDIRAHLKDESHQSRPSTYRFMRRLYVGTRGHSQVAWSALFRTFRREDHEFGPDELRLAERVATCGYAVEPGFLPRDTASRIAEQVLALGGAERSPVRVDYPQNLLLSLPEIRRLLVDQRLLAAAAT